MKDNYLKHMARVKEGVWMTSDGRRYHLREMEASHVVNTIRYLRRWADDVIYIDKMKGTTVDAYLEETCPCWRGLLAEADKRGVRRQADKPQQPAKQRHSAKQLARAIMLSLLDNDAPFDTWGNS